VAPSESVNGVRMSQLELSLHLLVQHEGPVYAIAALFGLMIGSFVNVVVFRLPKSISSAAATETHCGHWPMLGARSKCPSCKRAIRWHENIPVISYLWLKGRCSGCHEVISPRYPLVELLVGALAVLIIWYFGLTWEALARFAFCCLLLALALIDLDHFILPDALTLPAIWVGLLINTFALLAPAQEAILGAATGWGCLAVINLLYKLMSGRDGIGRGDWKIAAAIGAWLGFSDLMTALFTAFLIGGLIGIGLLIGHRGGRHSAVPFGPLLAIGGSFAVFLGPDLMNLYLEWVTKGVL